GEVPDTPRPDDPLFARVDTVVIANLRLAADGAARRAAELGYRASLLDLAIEVEAREVGGQLAARARREARHGRGRLCLTRGGDGVRLKDLPPGVVKLPRVSQEVFRYCVGRTYRVEEIDSQGLFVLDVSADVARRFGGYMNDIRVEEEYLEVVPKRGTP